MSIELVQCEHCKAMLKPKNIQRHLQKVHLTGSDGKRLPVPKRRRGSGGSKLKPYRHEPKEEICPVCGGDGGVRGGCYKCDGSGWVSSATRAAYQGNTLLPGNQDTSRISNANYKGSNVGAHYREHNGRIGSNPEHDDYSDEGTA